MQIVNYFRIILLVVALFLLTCALCWVTDQLLLVNPLFGIFFLLSGSLGVVLAADVVKSHLLP
jgi:hypothetical protein